MNFFFLSGSPDKTATITKTPLNSLRTNFQIPKHYMELPKHIDGLGHHLTDWRDEE